MHVYFEHFRLLVRGKLFVNSFEVKLDYSLVCGRRLLADVIIEGMVDEQVVLGNAVYSLFDYRALTQVLDHSFA